MWRGDFGAKILMLASGVSGFFCLQRRNCVSTQAFTIQNHRNQRSDDSDETQHRAPERLEQQGFSGRRVVHT